MKAIIITAALAVVFFGLVFGVKAKDSTSDQKVFDLKTRKIACQYFLFPWKLDSWARVVQSGNKLDRFQEEKLLKKAAVSLNIVLSPKPMSVTRNGIQKAIVSYLLIAQGNADSLESSLPKTAFILGMKSNTIQGLLKIGVAKPIQAGTRQNNIELGKEFDSVMVLSRNAGLPETLNTTLESIKTKSLSAGTSDQYLAQLKRIRQWKNDVVAAFSKPVSEKRGGGK